jgi:GT2 family glycosyltransferase
VSTLNLLPQVSCIILNWNGWAHTGECLSALRECTYQRITLIVVDNASTDNSVAQIRAAFPDVLVLESGKNLGFAGGNNLGICHALAHGADYVWLLNNDTKPDPHALSALVIKALTDTTIGAVASVCYYAESPSTVQAWAGARINLWTGSARLSMRPRPDEWFDALNGTSFLISRAALENVGLLDDNFFLYWEDTEFCLRLRKRGWRIAAAPNSRVLHKVGASTGRSRLILDRYEVCSGLRLLTLYSPAPRLARLCFLARKFARRLALAEVGRCRSVSAGARDYYQSVRISKAHKTESGCAPKTVSGSPPQDPIDGHGIQPFR